MKFSEAVEYIVNRIEVIDWRDGGDGRVYTKLEDKDFGVGFDIQDNGRTLKVFLTSPESENEDEEED